MVSLCLNYNNLKKKKKQEKTGHDGTALLPLFLGLRRQNQVDLRLYRENMSLKKKKNPSKQKEKGKKWPQRHSECILLLPPLGREKTFLVLLYKGQSRTTTS